ncbi:MULTISPECIES: hypothetical protein [Pseudoalteromonas]|uniref:hypothetical protein n=1 Tax=Pseudoalteromonas TaxID=53246 RepID=UPI00147FA80F|nr:MULTISPECIES: hypothetical protein [Pseudoalteromonas]
MVTTTENLKNILDETIVKDKAKLEHQQKYYQRLKNKGVAQKQTYNLKPNSSF